MTAQLIILATHMVYFSPDVSKEKLLCHYFMVSMFSNIYTDLVLVFIKAGLGLPDTDSWYIIETIAGKNNIGYSHIVS